MGTTGKIIGYTVLVVFLALFVAAVCDQYWPWPVYHRLRVRDLTGPSVIDGNHVGRFELDASGGGWFYRPHHFEADQSYRVEWSCEPEDAGWFTSEGFRIVTFTAVPVEESKEASITVQISTERDGVHERSMNITIRQSAELDSWTRVWGDRDAKVFCEAVEVDDSGSIYVTGGITGKLYLDPSPVDLDPSPSVIERTRCAYLSKFNPNGDLEWVQTWLEGGAYGSAFGSDIAIDTAGDIYVTGHWSGDMNGEPGWLHSWIGKTNAFLGEFSSEGEMHWLKRWGGSSREDAVAGLGVDVAESGEICVCGRFAGTVDFHPGSEVAQRTCAKPHHDGDAFLSRFNPDGEYLWVRTWSSPDETVACDVAIDSDNNIILVGYFQVGRDMDPGPNSVYVQAYPVHILDSLSNCFLLKLDSGGSYLWSRNWGGWGRTGAGIHLDQDGGIVVYGTFRGLDAFHGGSGARVNVPNIWERFYLVEFGADGDLIWIEGAEETLYGDNLQPSDLAMDSAGHLYMTGKQFEGPGRGCFVVRRFSADGVRSGEWRQGALGLAEGRSVAVDSLGNVCVAGRSLWDGVLIKITPGSAW